MDARGRPLPVVNHDQYTCEWLAGHNPLPPPIRRMAGGFCITGDDCDRCSRYEAPKTTIAAMGLSAQGER